MDHDVELMRDLLLMLEQRQSSPRTTVVIAVEDEADDLGRIPEAVEDGLNTLLDLDYIEGPGPDSPGLWLFRKLTRKGLEFVRQAREPAEWERIKRRYARQGSAPRA